MAQDMTEKELLKMELDQLKKEVKNERQMVSLSPKTQRGRSPGQLPHPIVKKHTQHCHQPSNTGRNRGVHTSPLTCPAAPHPPSCPGHPGDTPGDTLRWVGCSQLGDPTPGPTRGCVGSPQRGPVPGVPVQRLLPRQVSKTGKELKEYIESMAGEDPLLKGVPEDKNPFKEKGGCTIS